ncbi:hypothetical protein B296_00053818 [Ensete ventricosum]|uniref:MORF/ORRM1/DAG-like MORF domain-containing protein n=1 Tax=Ensete ventricosum TaxID=4639 RepID=A0A426Y6Z3_ENSVE|nr:hypothetical protein B296_00053818 [Ensete ventricosum]
MAAAGVSRCAISILRPARYLLLGSSSSAAAAVAHPFLGLRVLHPSRGFLRLAWVGAASRIGAIRSMARRAGDSSYSPLNSSRGGSGFSDRPPTEMAPLFPGCDYEHWLIVMDKPGGEGASKQQMIDCYVQTLAKVVGR